MKLESKPSLFNHVWRRDSDGAASPLRHRDANYWRPDSDDAATPLRHRDASFCSLRAIAVPPALPHVNQKFFAELFFKKATA
jgi:hypothetical protein